MVIVAGKNVDFQGIAGFLNGLKPDIISIYLVFRDHLQTTIYGGVPHFHKKECPFWYYSMRIS